MNLMPCCDVSVDKALHNISVFIYAAVAKERPPTTHLLAVGQVDVYYFALFLMV